MIAEKLQTIKRELILYATFVDGMIDKSIKGLLERKGEWLDEVIDHDERKANEYELRILVNLRRI